MWCKNDLVTTALESEKPDPARSGAKRGSVVKGLIKTIRPHQWVKNLFVMAPMFFHKDLFGTTANGDPTLNLKVAGEAFLATAVFCLLAGAVYTINDLVDVEADRTEVRAALARPDDIGRLPEHRFRADRLGEYAREILGRPTVARFGHIEVLLPQALSLSPEAAHLRAAAASESRAWVVVVGDGRVRA